MTLKTIYFVRHGESIDASNSLPQQDDSPLSAAGKEQANVLANRLQQLPIEIIKASNLQRALETAEVISSTINRPIETNKAFNELEGEPKGTFISRIQQANAAIGTITQTKATQILVVSHGGFIKTMVASMLFGPEIRQDDYLKFIRFTTIRNTGITVCKLFNGNRWKLTTWNDFRHIEEAA